MTKYLYQREGSSNWWLRLVYPESERNRFGGKARVERSLGTPDRREAEIRAADEIQAHRKMMLERRLWRAGRFRVAPGPLLYPLGQSTLDDGIEVFATEREVLFIRNGQVIDTDRNQVVNEIKLEDEKPTGPAPLPKDTDAEIVEDWIRDAAISPRIADDARRTLALFKQVTGGKRFADADFDDGRALVDALFAQGLKTASVGKLVGWLRVAVNRARMNPKKYPDLKMNPFSNVAPKKVKGPNGKMVSDATKRLAFDDDDMANVALKVHVALRQEDKLLWLLLASTGMRLGEAFQISEEFREGKIRYVKVGTKTEGSYREVPLPDCLVPYLPARIKGPLFKDCSDDAIRSASKRLNRFIRRCGIEDERKVLHSLRHRAATRLREVGCPMNVAMQILGHDDGAKVHNGYGHHPLAVRKHWIDQIGCA